MRPHLFLDLAGELAEGSGPAAYRSAISRAYYALFNVAEEFFERMGFRRPKRDYHVVVQRRLLASGDQELEQIGARLSRLHSDRVRADYQMADKWSEDQENARKITKDAARMTHALDNCAINSDRWKAIQKTIQRIKLL